MQETRTLPPQPQNDKRKTKIILLAGVRGCGKSTYAERLARTAERSLMITPTFDDFADKLPECKCRTRPDFSYTGMRCRVYKNENDLRAILKHFHNGILILDDPLCYVRQNWEESALKGIVSVSRKMMLDIIFVVHGWDRVPPILFSFITDVVLFQLTSEPSLRKKYLGSKLAEIERIQAEVNRQAKTNPYAKMTFQFN